MMRRENTQYLTIKRDDQVLQHDSYNGIFSKHNLHTVAPPLHMLGHFPHVLIMLYFVYLFVCKIVKPNP